MRPLAEEWRRKADEDFAVAERELAAAPPAFAAVCFHAQQAVEKYLKALLAAAGKPAPKTHDLNYLLKLLGEEGKPFAALAVDLAVLSLAAVEVRYPGVDPDKKRAQAAVATMQSFFALVAKSRPLEPS